MAIKRNRLSSIDLLPTEAEPDVAWAIAEIESNSRHIKDICAEFNSRLADRGIGPISPSAFSRYSLRKRRAFLRLKEVREISNVLASVLEPGDDDALMLTISQFVKTAAIELLETGKTIDTKGLMEIAKAMQSIASAQRTSKAHRKDGDKEAADKAISSMEKVAREAGLPAERIAQLRREFLGVRPKPKGESLPGHKSGKAAE